MGGKAGGNNGKRKGAGQADQDGVLAALKGLAQLPDPHHLQVVEVGDYWAGNEHVTPRNELIHVLQGQARIVIAGRALAVRPGDTFLVRKGIPHRDVRQGDAPYRVIYMFFSWEAGEELLSALRPRDLLGAPSSAKLHLQQLIKEMESEYLAGAPGSDDRIRLLLFEALVAMSRLAIPRRSGARQAEQRSAKRHQWLAAQTRSFLEEHFDTSFSLDELAEKQGVSPYHLCRVFSREFGQSITDFTTLTRIDRAKSFLTDPRLSVKEVANKVGFSNANYFAKVFRRATGQSPSAYQAEVLRPEGKGRGRGN